MVNILVSACLLGENCKYNGNNNYNEDVLKLKKYFNIIPVCPEVFGGFRLRAHRLKSAATELSQKTGQM